MTDKLELRHKLPASRLIRDRDAWILDQAQGHKVLHVGCVDVGFSEHQLDRGKLLHAQLGKVCAGLMGVDIDAPGIERLRSLGYEDVICREISEEHDQVIDDIKKRMQGCDLIVCGEVLEHVLNYGRFLAGVREAALAYNSTVIITVPNTFSLEGIVSVAMGVEKVHPDHKCYFSQVTLNTLLNQTGFRATETYFYSNNWANTRLRNMAKRIISNMLLVFRPQLAEGLIAVAKPIGSSSAVG